MEISSLKCNHCSADLKINPKIKFFNCSFCGSSLTIKQTGNVIYTEVLDSIKDNTATLIDKSDLILLEKEIARLDRDWETLRESYKITNNKGGSYYPDEINVFGQMVSALIFLSIGLFFISKIASIMAPHDSGSINAIIGFLFIVVVLGFMASAYSSLETKKKYINAKKRYHQERKSLLKKLNDLKR